MNGSGAISFVNTGLPLVILGALAGLVPFALVGRKTRRHWEVAVGIWASAGIVLLAGAVIFGLLYGVGGVGVGTALGTAPLATGAFFLKLSGYAALAWGPVLALSWLVLAQRVERRKGEDKARKGSE